ncbi:MAG: phosphomannomutase/phosphoglucomutase [Clostridiales bacterium]|nr:phosphomannomutase/phosphoglucomutase [Clostridiales bacterium]MDY5468871.1 phosphomannomutase/phosphoglucomutase [Eubacteriales bacterium]
MTDYQSLKSGTDIRGDALGEKAVLTNEVALCIGGAFITWLSERTGKHPGALTVAIGRDSRLTGPALLAACAEGMARTGAQVWDYGMCTTPAMYMSLLTEGFKADASIMVTASHHPYYRNGLKFFLPEGGVSATDISMILSIAANTAPVDGPHPAVQKRDFLPVYKQQLMDRMRRGLDTDVACPLLGLHVVVDAGNGAGGFYEEMLREMGAWTEGSQFLEPDGHFPNHIPNPENEQAMAAISQAVVRVGADLGVIFDADCDRAAIVDAAGREINRNRLIALISAILLDKEPGATIVTDSVTSSGLAQFITEWGGVHYRYKRGYRNVIDEAVRLNAAGIDCPLAIETSGHAALRENHFLDDGMYLVTVLIVEAMRLKQEGKELSSLLDGLREPVESVELRLNITAPDFREAGRTVIERVMDHASYETDWHIAPDNREGVRINFDLDDGLQNGWFLLRLSVHDPVLPLNVESDVPGGVRTMLSKLLSVLDGIEDIDISPIRAYLSKN